MILTNIIIYKLNIFFMIFYRPGDPTYKDIINQSLEKAKNLEKQFKE